MPINSRAKGARCERQFAAWLRGWRDPDGNPIQARRGQQHKGGSDSPDVIHSLKGVHFEVASRQSIDHGTEALREKYYQADIDCVEVGTGKTLGEPIVAWRKRKRWWMTLDAVATSMDRFAAIPMTAPAEDVMRALGCTEIEP